MNRVHWQDWIAALIGLWLIALPFTLNSDLPIGAPSDWIASSFIGMGVVIAGMAFLAMVLDQTWEDLGIGMAGAWLFVSPWVLGFTSNTTLTGNALFCGGAAIILALWSYVDGSDRFQA